MAVVKNILARFAVDHRAACLMRVCIGLYALGDLLARLAMPGSLYWYTGNDVEPMSTFAVGDSPHKATIHKYLFYRGTWEFQAAVFLVHFVIAMLYTLGIRPNFTGFLLWFATMTMHGRQECFHDGSDKYFRNLLLWSCFIDSSRSRSYKTDEKGDGASGNNEKKASLQVSIGTIGYIFQIVLMYAGVIAIRSRVPNSVWFDGTAVGIALNTSFATRNFFVANIPWLCNILTYFGIITEAIAPLLIFIVTPSMKYGRLAVILFVWAIHGGIFVMFNLPQWCLFASLAPIILTPSWILDWLDIVFPTVAHVIWGSSNVDAKDGNGKDGHRSSNTSTQPPSPPTDSARNELRQRVVKTKITTGTTGTTGSDNEQMPTIEAKVKSRKSSEERAHKGHFHLFWKAVGVFLFAYMCHEWLSTDGNLIDSFDNGDIGQSIRFYQGWVMFRQPQKNNGHWFTVHAFAPAIGREDDGTHRIMVDVDVLETLNARRIITTTPAEMTSRTETIPSCTTCLYPSWRYERFLHQQPTLLEFKNNRIWPLSRHWCHMIRNMLTRDVSRQMVNATLPANDKHGERVFEVLDVDYSQLQLHTVVTGFKVVLPSSDNATFKKKIRKTEVDVTIKCTNWKEFEQDVKEWNQE
eukprot:m.82698 g.82698  ORF g.82698 m.82698 type:complete len:635 (+) comp8673_c0_seq1:114-2018(+)